MTDTPITPAQTDALAKSNPEAYAAVLSVVRAAWALVDNTGHHDWLPLVVSRDDWNELAGSLSALKALIPAEELPAEPPYAVTCLWPSDGQAIAQTDALAKLAEIPDVGSTKDDEAITLAQLLEMTAALDALNDAAEAWAARGGDQAHRILPLIHPSFNAVYQSYKPIRAALLAGAVAPPPPAPAQEGRPYGIIDPDYARIFTIARCIAWSEGYAMLMHGSFTRDLDLLAVPWAEQATDADHLIQRIACALDDLDILVKDPAAASQATVRPHGRRSWTLTFKAFGDPRFIDIGVMPAAPPPPALAQSLGAANAFVATGWGIHDMRPYDTAGGRWCGRCGLVETTCSIEGQACKPLWHGALPYGGHSVARSPASALEGSAPADALAKLAEIPAVARKIIAEVADLFPPSDPDVGFTPFEDWYRRLWTALMSEARKQGQRDCLGATPMGSGSQASPEAPTDPRPTGVDPSRNWPASYQETFDAISAAVTIHSSTAIGISVRAFYKALSCLPHSLHL